MPRKHKYTRGDHDERIKAAWGLQAVQIEEGSRVVYDFTEIAAALGITRLTVEYRIAVISKRLFGTRPKPMPRLGATNRSLLASERSLIARATGTRVVSSPVVHVGFAPLHTNCHNRMPFERTYDTKTALVNIAESGTDGRKRREMDRQKAKAAREYPG